MNTLEFLWRGGGPHDGGTHLEWRVGGWGLSPKFFRMRVYPINQNTFLRGSTHFTFHGGALISYISIPCFPLHRPVTRSFDAFFDLRLNKRLSKQSRRRWVETPLHSLWHHCYVVPKSDPMIRAAVGSFGVQRVTLVQFWIGETGQIGGFRALWKEWPQIWNTALSWVPFREIYYILHSVAVKLCGVRSSRN